MRHLTSIQEFLNFINGRDIVVLDCYAQWCGPCKRIAPELEALAASHPDIGFAKVDVEEADDDFCKRLYVSALPTFVFLRRGQIVGRVEGADMGAVKRQVETMSVPRLTG
jgi:thioredoxin 1